MIRLFRIVFLILLFVSCIDDRKKVSTPRISKSYSFSKENGLLVRELYLQDLPAVFHNTDSVTSLQSWIENSWKYDRNGDIVSVDQCQLVVHLKTEVVASSYFGYWKFCIGEDCSSMYQGDKIAIDIPCHLEEIILNIKRFERAFDYSSGVSVGEIILSSG